MNASAIVEVGSDVTTVAPTPARFRIVPLPAEFIARVRGGDPDDFGRPGQRMIARGGEPVRDQLRRVAVGEEIILCSFTAVDLPSRFAETGPIFVTARDTPSAGPLPPAGRLPAGYFVSTFALRAYDAAAAIARSCLVEPAAAPAQIEEYLRDPAIRHVDARFGGHGCFACRFVRVTGP